MFIRTLLVASISQVLGFAAMAGDVPLIPRETLFGNPERANVQISPDGTQISYLAPLDGVLNVWVMPVSGGEAAAITKSMDRPIRSYGWSWNNEQILYEQDKGGNEDTHIYAVNLADGKTTDLTPGDGVKAGMMGGHRDRPDLVLSQSNARDPRHMDVVTINTRTGEQETIFLNEEGFVGMTPDDDWNVRIRARMTPDGGTASEFRDSPDGEWRELDTVGLEDAMSTNTSGFDKSGRVMWGSDARGGDKARFVAVRPQPDGTFERETIFESDESDVADVMMNPLTKQPEAVAVNRLRTKWTILDPSVEPDLLKLSTLVDGELNIVDRSGDDRTWIAAYLVDDGPVQYWLWNRDTQEGRYLFSNRPSLEGLPLANMKGVEIPARDGLMLPSYLTLPLGLDAGERVPLIVFVHGGPWARDNWGYNPYHQWLANRGYAVLSVNFRGSTGFGKAFLNAGNREWYKAMQDDINDAAQWAVDQGWADPERLAIMGGSYGGYATLAGMTRDPELWACGVDIVGPSHVGTLLSTIPAYWEPVKVMFEKRVGGADETEWLDEISPLVHVDRIARPLLIGQGANDPRVKLSESDQIVDAMDASGIPVTYVVFPDEGHGFARPENNKAFNAITEAFLGAHLGGRVEALGDDVAVSSAQVRRIGGLDLGDTKEWEGGDTPAPVLEAVSFDDLTESQQGEVTMMLEQLESQIPAEAMGQMLPMIIMQLKGQMSGVPETERPVALYLLGELERRAAAMKSAPSESPVPAGE